MRKTAWALLKLSQPGLTKLARLSVERWFLRQLHKTVKRARPLCECCQFIDSLMISMQHSHILSHRIAGAMWGLSLSVLFIAEALNNLLASEEEAAVNCQSSYRQLLKMYCLTFALMNGRTATYVRVAAPYFMQHSRRESSGRVKMRKGMQKRLTGSSLEEAPVCLREQILRQLHTFCRCRTYLCECCHFLK